MSEAPPPPGRRFGRRIGRGLGVVIAVILLAMIVAAVWYRYEHSRIIFDAVVDGERTIIVARTDGVITELRTAIGQVVNAGDALFVIAPGPGADMGADARASADALRERVQAGEREEKAARDAMQQAALAHSRAQLALRGAGQPVPGSEASRQEHERLRTEERKARNELDAAKMRYEAVSHARQSVESAYRQTREAIARYQTEAREGRLLRVLATPGAGRVSVLDVAVGRPVREGQTLAVIEPVLPEQFWVVGFVRPQQVTTLRPQQRVGLRFADHPSLQLTGQVDMLRADADLKNLPGVPVRIVLHGYDPLTMPTLVPGQQVDVRLD